MTLFYRIGAGLWVFWGLVHMFAGVMTMAQPIAGKVGGIADAVDKATLDIAYPDAVGAILNQHGWNLLWIGAFTVVGGVYIWRQNKIWVLFTAVVGGMADIGYFMFMDLGGYVNFVPGTLMTLVSSAAVILTFLAAYRTPSETA
ncbi:MAG: hypothetical protein AAFR65_09555 [Pseudomonadota bacterium]